MPVCPAQPLWMVSRPHCRLLSHSLFSTPLTFLYFPSLLTLFSLTGCHDIFSQLLTISYSATTDLNTDLALSVPLRQEREIPYPQLPPTMLQGWILPVSSVFWLLEYGLLFLPDSYTFRFSADQCPDWKTLLLAQRDGKPWHIDPNCQYRLGLSDKRYLQHLSTLWLGTSLILGYNWYCDAGSEEVKLAAFGFSYSMSLCVTPPRVSALACRNGPQQ